MQWQLLDDLTRRTERGRARPDAPAGTFGRGDVLFHEGDPADTVHLIAEGRVMARRTTPMGTPSPCGSSGPAGPSATWRSAAGPSRRCSTVTALEPTVTLTISFADFRTLMAEYPTIRDQLETLLSARVPPAVGPPARGPLPAERPPARPPAARPLPAVRARPGARGRARSPRPTFAAGRSGAADDQPRAARPRAGRPGPPAPRTDRGPRRPRSGAPSRTRLRRSCASARLHGGSGTDPVSRRCRAGRVRCCAAGPRDHDGALGPTIRARSRCPCRPRPRAGP